MKVLIRLSTESPQTNIIRSLTPLELRDLLSKPAWVPVNYLGWRWCGTNVYYKILSYND